VFLKNKPSPVFTYLGRLFQHVQIIFLSALKAVKESNVYFEANQAIFESV
jgi:hypothetical protein